MTPKRQAVEAFIRTTLKPIEPKFQVILADEEKITLEDVLRVVKVSEMYVVDTRFCMVERGLHAYWLLGKPLSEQSDEVVEFLHSILCA